MAITTSELMNFKKQCGELRDKALQANATMKEVDSNIEILTKELKDLGVKNVDKVDEEIQKLEAKAQSLYEEAYKKVEKWI